MRRQGKKKAKTDAFFSFFFFFLRFASFRRKDPWGDDRSDCEGGGFARGGSGSGNEEGCGGWEVGGEGCWDSRREVLDEGDAPFSRSRVCFGLFEQVEYAWSYSFEDGLRWGLEQRREGVTVERGKERGNERDASDET